MNNGILMIALVLVAGYALGRVWSGPANLVGLPWHWVKVSCSAALWWAGSFCIWRGRTGSRPIWGSSAC